MFQNLILAAGDGGLATVIIVGIAIISGIYNFITERIAAAKLKEQQAANGGGRKNDKLRTEVDSFLDEISNSPSSTPQRRRKPTELTFDDLMEESVPQRPARTRPQPKSESQPKSQSNKPPKNKPVAQRHLQNSDIGQVRQRHVESHVAESHLKSQVGQGHLATSLNMSGTTGAATAVSVDVKSAGAVAVALLLSNPQSVRDAIVMNEILSPPLSRRRR